MKVEFDLKELPVWVTEYVFPWTGAIVLAWVIGEAVYHCIWGHW